MLHCACVCVYYIVHNFISAMKPRIPSLLQGGRVCLARAGLPIRQDGDVGPSHCSLDLSAWAFQALGGCLNLKLKTQKP